jgi:hypothetical protein
MPTDIDSSIEEMVARGGPNTGGVWIPHWFLRANLGGAQIRRGLTLIRLREKYLQAEVFADQNDPADLNVLDEIETRVAAIDAEMNALRKLCLGRT